MKKICLLGLFVVGFALSSHAQQVSNTQNPVSVETASSAVTPTKSCCKKNEVSATSCCKTGSTAKSKECSSMKGSAAGSSKSKCGEGSEANSSVSKVKKSCTTPNCQKPCCKKV